MAVAAAVLAPTAGQGRGTRGDVEILVLGPVDLAGGEMGAVEPSRRMAALGLLAYMASHDRPVSADQLARRAVASRCHQGQRGRPAA